MQSGFLTLHSLTMLMKVHSYLAHNGALSEKRIDLRKAQRALDAAVEEKGGWSRVLYLASQEATHENAVSVQDSSPTKETFGEQLHHRRKSSDRRNSNGDIVGVAEHAREASLVGGNPEDPKDPRRLVDFSDERIYNLANDCVDLQEELTSSGKEAVVWPANVTSWNYIDYLLVPSLVYELEYPRTTSIRPLYVLEKTLATFGTFFLVYAITEHVIIPSHEASKANPLRADNFLAAALDLILPFMINYLLIFYIIFECVCNGFAELTRFADRGFYSDWWNAVTWDEFARKWNKPVHQVRSPCPPHFLITRPADLIASCVPPDPVPASSRLCLYDCRFSTQQVPSLFLDIPSQCMHP